MIVVAIVAILAAIAYPSYIESIRKSRRAEARAQLLEAAQFMHRFYSQNERFDRAIGATTDFKLPTALTQVPRQGAATYAIGFAGTARATTSFALQAVPTGTMVGDRCGTFLLTNTGRKDITGALQGVVAADCWR
ncbi:MAG: type IV pilin protein [Variovorax sp.]